MLVSYSVQRFDFLDLDLYKMTQITMDLPEFNVNAMTRNKKEHQCSPYDPGIQK